MSNENDSNSMLKLKASEISTLYSVVREMPETNHDDIELNPMSMPPIGDMIEPECS
jgi:hypothetical protein